MVALTGRRGRKSDVIFKIYLPILLKIEAKLCFATSHRCEKAAEGAQNQIWRTATQSAGIQGRRREEFTKKRRKKHTINPAEGENNS